MKLSPGEADMASLTIRKLDDAVKTYLRLRSAQNGRSVEEEVRVILQGLVEPTQIPAAPSHEPHATGNRMVAGSGPATGARVTLIIGGGIAAYKSLDLIRRLK